MLREEDRLEVFEVLELRRIIGPSKDEMTGNCIMRIVIPFTPRQGKLG
jgi:hypothetical protein